MKPGPTLVSKIILERFPIDSPPRPIVDIITEIILQENWDMDKAIARERAEIWSENTLNILRSELNHMIEIGRPPRYMFNPSSSYMIQGVCFIAPHDSQDLRESKLRRLKSNLYFDLFAELSPDQFEDLCGKFIGLLGVTDPVVTRRSADEGIDFFGKLSLESIFFPQDLTPTLQKQLVIWLVGQAKHYKSIQSGTQEIRDLVGSVTLGRSSIFGSLQNPYPELKIRVGDPVFIIFMTTGTFSSNSWRLMNRSGVIGMDGEMLAAFLADRGIGVVDGQFSKMEFLNWISAD
jgi:hypothetical protein